MSEKKAGSNRSLHISEMVLGSGGGIREIGKTRRATQRQDRHENDNSSQKNNWSPLTSYLEKAAHLMNEIGGSSC